MLIPGLQVDHKTLQQKNAELVEMYREKSKKQAQTQHLYDTLKKRVMTSQVQTAASDTVAQMSKIPRPQTFADASIHQLQPTSLQAGDHRGNEQYPETHSRTASQASGNAHVEAGTTNMPPPMGSAAGHHNRELQPSFSQRILTPSDGFAASTPQHRTHLPGTVRTAATRSQIPLITRAPGTAQRQPLANVTNSRNSHSGSSGYGITAGMKVGRPPRSNLSDGEQRSDRYHGTALLPPVIKRFDISADQFNINGEAVQPFGNERPFSTRTFY
jgi:E3 ubiquitin-protein ligase CCNP1IP1